jgi:hypothetical protein
LHGNTRRLPQRQRTTTTTTTMSDSFPNDHAAQNAGSAAIKVEAVTDELAAALNDLRLTSPSVTAEEDNVTSKVNIDDAKDDDDDDDKKEDTADKDIARWLSEAPEALRHFAAWIEAGHMSRIIVVAGAGLSVAAGIPDFRTPGTGLYDNLQKYNLPYPEAVFDLDFFAKHPQPFVQLARELWPGLVFRPTLTHSFLTLLHQKGLLLRCYTQNIDGLEHLGTSFESRVALRASTHPRPTTTMLVYTLTLAILLYCQPVYRRTPSWNVTDTFARRLVSNVG